MKKECEICCSIFKKSLIRKCKYKHIICISCLHRHENRCYYCFQIMKNKNVTKKILINSLYTLIKIFD